MKNIFVSLLVLMGLITLSMEVSACHRGGDDHHKGKFMGLIDTDEDEKLSSLEMENAAVKMFKKHDLNNDGVITLAEVKNDNSAKFKEIDANSDGFADRSELRKHFKTKMKEVISNP